MAKSADASESLDEIREQMSDLSMLITQISKALKPESLRLCIAIAGGEVRFQLPSSNMSLIFWNEKKYFIF